MHIDKRRVWLLTALAVYYNLDFGLVVRYLAGEYMTKWRDIDVIVGAVEGLVSDIDLQHICRILTSGCPAEFNWEELAENKETFIRRGNNPSMNRNIKIVTKILNREERNNHVVPFARWVARGTRHSVIIDNVDKKLD